MKHGLHFILLAFSLLLLSKPVLSEAPSKIKTEKECKTAGGVWGQIGLFPEEQCNLPTKDGGRECTDSSQCEGKCVAKLTDEERAEVYSDKEPVRKSGGCTEMTVTTGCLAEVRDGVVKGVLCFD